MMSNEEKNDNSKEDKKPIRSTETYEDVEKELKRDTNLAKQAGRPAEKPEAEKQDESIKNNDKEDIKNNQ